MVCVHRFSSVHVGSERLGLEWTQGGTDQVRGKLPCERGRSGSCDQWDFPELSATYARQKFFCIYP
ncbi:hypothetical protein PCLA_03r0757 [Pseudomonas citronellolis]|nr:hypothetical protein PCLA_03r0757 [Pseudomonas citronellolis]